MSIGDFIIKNRKKFLILIICITIFFISILSKGIKYEFEEESFLPENEVVKANERILKEYTKEYLVPILIKSKSGNVLNKSNLIEILIIEKKLYENFSVMPISIADIIITNATYEEKIKIIKKLSDKNITQIISLPFFKKYASLFLSKDFNGKEAKATIIKFGLNGSLIKNRKYALENESKISAIIGDNYKYIEVSVLGLRSIAKQIMDANNKSLIILLPLSFILVVIILIFVFGNFKDVIISLLALALAIIWMIGFGCLLDFTFNPLLTSIPVLLVGLGIDYGIHIKKKIEESGIDGVDKVAMALFLSAFTTSIAFLSNTSSTIQSLKQFGILSSFGIFSCLFIMLFFMTTEKEKKKKRKKELEIKIAHFIKRNKKIIATLTFILTLIFSFFALSIKAEFDMLDFLPKEMKVTHDIEYLLENFKAAEGEEAIIVIKGDVLEPSIFKKIHNIEENLGDDKYVVKEGILSISSLMEDYADVYGIRYNKSFSLLYKKYFENGLPKENTTRENIRELYDLLYRINPYDVKRILHEGYDECIIRIPTNTQKEEKNIKILYKELKEDCNDGLITGGIITSYIILKELRRSQINSLMITILISFIILESIFIRKKKLIGIISLSPVIISAIWIIGTMSLLNIPLTITTITVASLAVGLGIDYSIHMTYSFIREKDMIKCISSTSIALFGSALTTIASFSLLSFSFLPPLKIFGISIAIAISYSFLLCVFVLPIFLE